MGTIMIPCACNTQEHDLRFYYDEIDNCLIISVHLTKHRFLRRLWFGLKYVVGYQTKYGHFEEHVFDNKNCDRVLELFGRIKEREANTNGQG